MFLTTFDLDEYVYEPLRAGAGGFVLKDDPPEQLLAAVRTVVGEDALLSPAITKRVIKQFMRIPQPTPSKEAQMLMAGRSSWLSGSPRAGTPSACRRLARIRRARSRASREGP